MGRLVILLTLAVLALVPSAARAQSTIAGRVTDASGAVVPGATVEVSSPALIEQVRSAVTDEQGRYAVVELRPGTYNVSFSLEGFKKIRREAIEVASNVTVPVNATLELGTVTEMVTVAGTTPLVD